MLVFSSLSLSLRDGRRISSSRSPSICELHPLSIRTSRSRIFSSPRFRSRVDSSSFNPPHSGEGIQRGFPRVYHFICQVIFLFSSFVPLFGCISLLLDSVISILWFSALGWEQIDPWRERIHRGREEKGSIFLLIFKLIYLFIYLFCCWFEEVWMLWGMKKL